MAKIDVKIFDINQNKLNYFNQNYGYVPDTNIKIKVLDINGNIFSSSEGISNNRGFYTTEFFIPKNTQSETFTIIINAENIDSKSSRTLQIFNLGEVPDHDSSP
jgi:hypothetical protein